MTTRDCSDQGNVFHLTRFVSAQENVYDVALSELRQGRKTSHWMWFIFPQLEKYFEGQPDPRTMELLKRQS